jgi:hypothetical protein
MNPQTEELVGEIRQIVAQYRAEVPGGRRAWPEAIKSRVRAAFDLGTPLPVISENAGLSYHTLISWIPKDQRQRNRGRRGASREPGCFSQLRISPNKAITTVTVTADRKPSRAITASPRRQYTRHETATVTVTLPSGIRIDGVTAEFLSAWLGRENTRTRSP